MKTYTANGKLPSLAEIQSERCKRDPLYMAEYLMRGPGFDQVDEWQKEVLCSSENLLMNCARQSGKSTVSALRAVHQSISRDKSLIILISPSQRQSSELFRKTRELLSRLPIPPELIEDNMLSCLLANGSRIVSLPGTEKTIRGYSGATLIIEDEASRVADELYMALRPMLAVSKGQLILSSTPFGKRGHFWEAWDQGTNWKKVKIDAYQNPRITKEFLEEERRVMGDWWFRQEYVCEFLDPIDNVFAYDMVMNAFDDEVKPLFEVA